MGVKNLNKSWHWLFLAIGMTVSLHGQEPEEQKSEDSYNVLITVEPPDGQKQIPHQTSLILRAGIGAPEIFQFVLPEGRLEFRGLRKGLYFLTLRCPGYKDVERSLQVPPDLTVTVRPGPAESDEKLPEPRESLTVLVKDYSIPGNALKLFQRATKEGKKNPQKGIDLLEQALRIHPDFYQAYNNLGCLHFRHGDLTQASEAFERATNLNPNSAVTLRNLGRVYLQQKNYDKALAPLRRSAEIEPRNTQAWVALGDTYFQLGQFLLALGCYEKVAGLNPAAPVAYLRMGACYAQLQMHDEAFRQFDRFIALSAGSNSVR